MTLAKEVKAYHVHVYCRKEQIALCQAVRSLFLAQVSGIDGAGPVRNQAIGPHPLPMFEAWFKPEVLNNVRQWMLENRQGLSVMIHPLTGDDYLDHAKYATWIGEELPLNLDFL